MNKEQEKKNNDDLPEGYNYKPLPSYLTMGKSTIHGWGIYATEDLAIDHVLPITHVIFSSEILRVDYGGWINHSSNPNIELKPCIDNGIVISESALSKANSYRPKVIRPIKAGEELTLNYHSSICGSFKDRWISNCNG